MEIWGLPNQHYVVICIFKDNQGAWGVFLVRRDHDLENKSVVVAMVPYTECILEWDEEIAIAEVPTTGRGKKRGQPEVKPKIEYVARLLDATTIPDLWPLLPSITNVFANNSG